jgi:cytochrome c-type biogenesis protein
MFDISFWGAGLAGLLSFLSPCILPIVPFYLSYLAGVSMNQIAADTQISRAVRLRAFAASVFFALGVITVFMALGVSASFFGQMVREWFDVLRWVAAAVIIAMGLHFLGVIRIGFLYRQMRADVGSTSKMSLVGAYVIGLAFAFGWTPCVGPVLAAILFMALPFVLASLFIGPFMRWMVKFRRHLGKIEKVMGALLILFGILIGTNAVNYIAQWMLEVAPNLWLLL